MLKNCGHGAFEDLAMIDHLVLAILIRTIRRRQDNPAGCGERAAATTRGGARAHGNWVNG